ncbi:MAG: chromosome segregation ATPase [Podoviridae sp. ctbd591]|nr:MAG: chromosome segregation ATPase [Podoviridae sp. ctbd591]
MSYLDDGCHNTYFNGVPDGCNKKHCNNHGCYDRPPNCEPNKLDSCETGCLPPPIKPMCIIPGMNSQQQMSVIVRKTNECIERWNTIQSNCYEALNKCVGAAVSNGVYYDCEEVRLQNGYSENDNCPYKYVVIKATDKKGCPIKVKLKTAYGNSGNNGARQSMQDASFIYSANTIISAINPVSGRWSGPALIDGCPMEYIKPETIVDGDVLYGFNKGGAMLCFGPNTELETLKMCGMVDVIGMGIQILKDGNVTAAAESLTTGASIQAIGYKSSCGEKVFFSCGKENSPGMQGINVANVLKNMGCTTAVITCLQTMYPDITGTTYRGIENAVTPASDAIQQKTGLTGGVMFLGRLLNPPLEWQIPYNQAFWVVSKKPSNGFRNDFTTEVADLTQSLGGSVNNMASFANVIDNMQIDVLEVTQKIEKIESDVSNISESITQLETRVNAIEPKLTNLESDVETLKNCCNTVQEYMVTETEERKQSDTALGDRITALQIAIQEEATTRNDADNRLIEAIQNEASARATNDAKLDTKIDSEVAKLESAIQDIEVAAYTAGEGIIINNRVISVNKDDFPDNEKISELENKVNALPNYVAGEHIVFTQSGGNTSISADLTDLSEEIENTKTIVQENTSKIEKAEGDIENNASSITTIENEVNTIKGDISQLQSDVKEANISAGNGIEINTVDDSKEISVKIDSTLSFQPDGALHVDLPAPETGETTRAGYGIIISKNEDIATIAVNQQLVASTADIQNIKSGTTPLPYVKVSGDIMTGELIGTTFKSNVEMPIRDNNENHSAFGVDVEDNKLKYGGVGENTVFNNRVKITNVDTPSGDTDATPKDYVDNKDDAVISMTNTAIKSAEDRIEGEIAANTTEINEKIESTKNELQNNINVIDEAQTELQEQFSKLEDGSVSLPYVKKSGDSMSGPLSLVDSTGAVLGQLSLTENGLMILGGPAATGAHLTITNESVSIDKPTHVNGTVSANNATKDNELVTLEQLNAKPSGISQTDADARYIASSNGVSHTPVYFDAEEDLNGWVHIYRLTKGNGLQSAINHNGIQYNSKDITTTIDNPIPLQIGNPTLPSHAANKSYVDAVASSVGDGKFLPLTGGTMSGPIYITEHNAFQSPGRQVPTFFSIDARSGLYFSDDNNLEQNPVRVSGVGDPTIDIDAANKRYVDSKTDGLGYPVVKSIQELVSAAVAGATKTISGGMVLTWGRLLYISITFRVDETLSNGTRLPFYVQLPSQGFYQGNPLVSATPGVGVGTTPYCNITVGTPLYSGSNMFVQGCIFGTDTYALQNITVTMLGCA